jgi:threonine dehydrogenase-like Zn-dependent dehydrogenase
VAPTSPSKRWAFRKSGRLPPGPCAAAEPSTSSAVVPTTAASKLDTQLLHYSEITCKASFHHTPAHIRRALDFVSRGVITARDFVNRVEPLTNLLEVMRHLMSHNGHMKTAIIP